MPEPAIQLTDIAKTFAGPAGPVHALRETNLVIQPGERVAIMGRSGSGKSTLLNLIGLLDRPSAGTYRLMGRPAHQLTADEASRLRRDLFGFVFQSGAMIEDVTLSENVALPLRYQNIARRDERKRVAAVLDRVGLTPRAAHLPRQLSGGERQRAAIARAVVGGARILLADEPTGNLDSHHAAAVLELLAGLNDDGVTLLIVTHDAAVAAMAPRLIELADGRIVNAHSQSQEQGQGQDKEQEQAACAG